MSRRRVWRNPICAGAYVDLNYLGLNVVSNTSHFSGAPDPRSGLQASANWGGVAVRGAYDTWSLHYERDGLKQIAGSVDLSVTDPRLVDLGTNGLDDDNTLGVDDAGEHETAPPYAAPLRGIEVTMRILEYNTRQVRQTRVVSDFGSGM